MENITFNGYHLPTLARAARENGRPIDDVLAELIWRISCNESLPRPIAVAFMAEAGYIAWQGFPLTRTQQ